MLFIPESFKHISNLNHMTAMIKASKRQSKRRNYPTRLEGQYRLRSTSNVSQMTERVMRKLSTKVRDCMSHEIEAAHWNTE